MFSMTCILISTVGHTYGVGTPDTVAIFLKPFGILKAEPMPTWFTKKKKRTFVESDPFFFSPGFSGNGLLGVYTICGAFISMAFLRNTQIQDFRVKLKGFLDLRLRQFSGK